MDFRPGSVRGIHLDDFGADVALDLRTVFVIENQIELWIRVQFPKERLFYSALFSEVEGVESGVGGRIRSCQGENLFGFCSYPHEE